MNTPVRLVTKTADQEIQEDIVALLKEMLADAEAGKLGGIYVMAKELDGAWHSRGSISFNTREEIAALEILKYQRLVQCAERFADEP